MKITAVKDVKSDSYLQPQFVRSLPDALRAWEVVANEGDSLVSRFPDDFYLHHLGEFDVNTGVITVLARPNSLGSAREFKKKQEANQGLPFQPKSAPELSHRQQ